MVETRYVLSFSAGGLLYHESVVVAEAFAAARGDWDKAIASVEWGNLLQSRTVSTAKRKVREVRGRLQMLTNDEMKLLATGSRLDQKLILWLACCLRYQLLGDFAREVLRGKYLQLDLHIEASDIERFIEAKSVWHDELENLADSTRTKLQTVMMRMLRESELVTDDGIIVPPLMSRETQAVVSAHARDHFQFFPNATPE